MAKPYPLELRERAVAAVVVEERSQWEVARIFDVGIATLERWLARWRAGESLRAKQGKPGPAACLDEAAREQLRAQVVDQADARLGDHRRAWQQATGQRVSETTLWRGLRALGWTRKKSTSSTPVATRPSGRRGKPSTRA